MKILISILMMAGLLLASGCESAEQASGGHGHGHGHETHDDHAHGEEARPEGQRVLTHWGESLQLLAEISPLVVGQPGSLRVHVTRLKDHKPVAGAEVAVELTSEAGVIERFVQKEQVSRGVYEVALTPSTPGAWDVRAKVVGEGVDEALDLGHVGVFMSREEAIAAAAQHDAHAHGEEGHGHEGDHAHGHEENTDNHKDHAEHDHDEGNGHHSEGSIEYTIDQQWRVPFRVQEAKIRPMRPNIPAFARLILPDEASSVVVATREGRLVAPGGEFLRVGQQVARGQQLFGVTITPDGKADPTSLDLDISRAQIEVRAAQREYDRVAPLAKQGVIPSRRMDEIESRLSAARATLSSARRQRASISRAQRVDGRGADIDVPSPIAGQIAKLYVGPNAWVEKGQPLARVVDTDLLWLDVMVPEPYVGRLEEVSGAWFEFGAPVEVYTIAPEALVTVGAEVDVHTRTLPVRFRVNNPEGKLYAGMATEARLVVDAPRSGVAVDFDAIVRDGAVDVVFVQTSAESFERRPVELGIRDGEDVEILSGVSAGEWVVTRGAYGVKLASSAVESIGHGHAH